MRLLHVRVEALGAVPAPHSVEKLAGLGAGTVSVGVVAVVAVVVR